MKSKKNYKPIILQEAKEDMRSAALWYNKKKKGLGKDLDITNLKNIEEYINEFIKQKIYWWKTYS